MTDLPLPTRCIMAGDFNGHHPLWDSQVRNPKRHKALLELIHNNNLTLINKLDTYTYNYRTGQGRSVLDLALPSPATIDLATIDLVTNWAVMNDLSTGSDHEVVSFELTSSSIYSVPPPSTERDNWAEADWPTFHLQLLTTSANQAVKWQNLHQHPTDYTFATSSLKQKTPRYQQENHPPEQNHGGTKTSKPKDSICART